MTPPQASPVSSGFSVPPVFSTPELAKALTPKLTPWIRQSPTDAQRAFLLLTCREVLYGGAAGGGKSSALLAAALQYVDVPGYSAVIFRRTYADLAKPGALMDRAHSWLGGTSARWNENKKQWRFPSGAVLTFGHLETENDKYSHQGAEYQFIGFDELTQFSETQYRYLFSRTRRLKGHAVPIRTRAASNPGGEGHDWVYRRFFIEPTGDDPKARRRVFIPAKLADNPHLDEAEYRESLAELDPVTRRQLEQGDWLAKRQGEMFRREWFPVVDAPPRVWKPRIVRYWDTAATDPNEPKRDGKKRGGDPDYTVGLKLAEWQGMYWVLHVKRLRGRPSAVEDAIGTTAREDGHDVHVWLGEERGSAGKNLVSSYARGVLRGFVVEGYRETGDKATRAGPPSSAAEKGHVHVLRGAWNTEFFDELEAFPGPSHDDQVDALSGAFYALRGSGIGKIHTEPIVPVITGLAATPM
jgi:predicted phage terminase large subunit-like protein